MFTDRFRKEFLTNLPPEFIQCIEAGFHQETGHRLSALELEDLAESILDAARRQFTEQGDVPPTTLIFCRMEGEEVCYYIPFGPMTKSGALKSYFSNFLRWMLKTYDGYAVFTVMEVWALTQRTEKDVPEEEKKRLAEEHEALAREYRGRYGEAPGRKEWISMLVETKQGSSPRRVLIHRDEDGNATLGETEKEEFKTLRGRFTGLLEKSN